VRRLGARGMLSPSDVFEILATRLDSRKRLSPSEAFEEFLNIGPGIFYRGLFLNLESGNAAKRGRVKT
jgi:hypothetical protein